MKKPLIIISLVLLTASFSYAAPGQGLTSWDTQIEPVASSDLVGITDISDTTQSDNGSSKKATMAQVGAFMATLFTSKIGNETIAGVKTFSSSPIVPTPTTDMQVATKKYVDDNVGGDGALLDAANVWIAPQTFQAGANASLSAANFVLPEDFKIGGVQAINANATIDDTDKLLPASKVIAELSRIESLIVGGNSNYVNMPVAPFSDQPCISGNFGLVSGTLYFCEDGYYTGQLSLTSYSNPGYTPLVTYTLTITDPGNGDVVTCTDPDLSYPINCGNGGTACSPTAPDGASVSGLTATGYETRTFVGWTGDLTGSANPTTTPFLMSSNKTIGATFAAQSLAINADFELTQEEDLAGLTLEQSGGVINADYVPAISGAESLFINRNGSSYNRVWYPVSSPVTTKYYAFSWQAPSTASASSHGIELYYQGVLQGRTALEGVYRVKHGTAQLASIADPLTNTKYYNCGKFTTGTGGNGVHALNVGTNADPSLNTTTVLNTGTSQGFVDQVAIAQYGTNALIIDDFIVQDTPIAACSGAGL